MTRPPVLLAAAGAGALVLAGCGTQPHYSLGKTRDCLRSAGAKIVRPKNDFVAETAVAGAFRVELGGRKGNAATISFGRNEDEAAQTADGYVRFHASNVGVSDILEQQRNAVVLWKQHPTEAEQNEVTGCLK